MGDSTYFALLQWYFYGAGSVAFSLYSVKIIVDMSKKG